MAGMQTPEVTPDEDDGDARVGCSRSPFSPPDIGRASSPVSQHSPEGSPGLSPVAGSPGSPMSPEHATTSPTYSPAIPNDEMKTTSPEMDPLSPTYSARSPAYTPSASTFGASRSAASAEEKPRGKLKFASSSPVYTPARHKV